MKPIRQETRVNQAIRSRQVHLIDAEGVNHGLIETRFAQQQALNAGLDLVEVAAKDGIPVCKILDYGKFKYDQSKSKKSQPRQVTKEIKMSPRIDKHDIEIKMKQVERWISEGFKVYVVVQFRGRENTHKEIGFAILKQFVIAGANITPPKLEGNLASVWITKV